MKATDFVSILCQSELPIKMLSIYNADSKKVNQLEKLAKFPPDEKYLNVLKHLKKSYSAIKVAEFIDQLLK